MKMKFMSAAFIVMLAAFATPSNARVGTSIGDGGSAQTTSKPAVKQTNAKTTVTNLLGGRVTVVTRTPEAAGKLSNLYNQNVPTVEVHWNGW